jgi:hypothetical protein
MTQKQPHCPQRGHFYEPKQAWSINRKRKLSSPLLMTGDISGITQRLQF